MEERAKVPPGLPRANPTISYWQDPLSHLADHRTTATLPASTEYIIIGSGISGASICHYLQKHLATTTSTSTCTSNSSSSSSSSNSSNDSNVPSILMLEARQTCSGATGRNGGHTKAASYRSFPDHEISHGTSEAIKIARLEHAVIRETHALASKLGIECASTPCDTVDIIYADSALEQGIKAIEGMREVFGPEDPVGRYEVFGAEEARERFLTPGAKGAFKYEAGSISAYAFTVGLLEKCLGRGGLNLQTNTPALAIARAENSTVEDPRWVVETPRGRVEAKTVIVATNGYTAHLLPQMQGIVVPLRGQITAQRPGSGLPQKGMDTTYSFVYQDGYEYMITRPAHVKDAGTVVIGGGLGTLPHEGESEFGNTNDEELNVDLSKYLRECTERYYGTNWGQDATDERVFKEWSGIMGTSVDGLPYCGAVNGMDGVWASVSFNGHGMVMCLKCSEAVVDMIVEGKAKDWFPQVMHMSQHRLGGQFKGRLNMKLPPGEQMFKGTRQEQTSGI